MAAVMPALAEHYTVIALDLLGHGQSATVATTRWAPRQRRTRPPWPSGQERSPSSATRSAAVWRCSSAYQFPERIERLVLVVSSGWARRSARC